MRGGYFGNITTLRLVYQGNIGEYHEVIRSNIDTAKIACFGFRPSRIFDGAHIDTAITTGRKETSSRGSIETSDFILFTEGNRRTKIENIEYTSTEGFLLGDEIGDRSGAQILPKIGHDDKKEILERLKEQSDVTFRDVMMREKPESDTHILWKRRGVLYWINPMLEKLYEGSEVEPIYFEDKLERDFAFLIQSSSLYYTYWLTYSNLHHHNWTHIRPFPYPLSSKIEEKEEEIHETARSLWEKMKGTFTQSREGRGDFHMRPLKPLIDNVDDLLADIYGLSDDELEYVQNYITDLGENSGRRAPQDADLSEFD